MAPTLKAHCSDAPARRFDYADHHRAYERTPRSIMGEAAHLKARQPPGMKVVRLREWECLRCKEMRTSDHDCPGPPPK